MYEGILVDVAFAVFFVAKVRPYFLPFFTNAQLLRFPPMVGSTKLPG